MSHARTSGLFTPAAAAMATSPDDIEMARQLMQHVLEAEVTQALKLIKANPKLFFIKVPAPWLRMRKSNGEMLESSFLISPFQAMFQTEYIALIKQAKPYINMVTDGSALAKQQLMELGECFKDLKHQVKVEKLAEIISSIQEFNELESVQRDLTIEMAASQLMAMERRLAELERLKEQRNLGVYYNFAGLKKSIQEAKAELAQSRKRKFKNYDATMQAIDQWKLEVWQIIQECKYLDFDLFVSVLNEYVKNYNEWFVGVGEQYNFDPDARKNISLLIHGFGFLEALAPKWVTQVLSQGVDVMFKDGVLREIQPEPKHILRFGAQMNFYHHDDQFSSGEHGEHYIGDHYYVNFEGRASSAYLNKPTVLSYINRLQQFIAQHKVELKAEIDFFLLENKSEFKNK